MKKNAFTLIELLAVIVILAIIALIATPIILGIIEDARVGSIEASANGYIDAVEYKIASNEIKGSEISSGVYDVTNLDVDIDGEKPTSGTITIENGDILEATLKINNYKVYYDGQISKIAYEDKILNGADPVLKDELVPVTIASDGTVKKANLSNEWYNYEDKEWANAVILFDGKTYKVGEVIPEEAIKEYYVWIPKYSYRLWNVNGDNTNNVGKPIEIVFGSKARTTGTNNGDMYIHPAFTNFGTQGLWVGKFELSYNEETYTNSNLFLEKNPNYEAATNPSELIIKPNVRNLSMKSLSSYHTLIYNSHRNLDSHVITNTEWGAAAYLTNSIYGRCDGNSCAKITNNNVNTGYGKTTLMFDGQWNLGSSITGCAADGINSSVISNVKNCKNNYNSEKGYKASTTGNISGIYDMVGGNWEIPMTFLMHSDGNFIVAQPSYSTGFKGIDGITGIEIDGIDLPNSKYYNVYKNNYELNTNIWYDYSEGLLGDATKEVTELKDENSNDLGLWNYAYAQFITTTAPYFTRGGSHSSGSGADIVSFHHHSGHAEYNGTTRAVLAF